MRETEKSFWIVLWVCVLGYLALEVSFAAAAIPKKEVYSALDPLEPQQEPTFFIPESAGLGEIPSSSPVAVSNQSHKPSKYSGVDDTPYERVPAPQLGSIVKRIAIVQQLLVRHHRAYDYQSFTTDQLLKILNQLDADVPTLE